MGKDLVGTGSRFRNTHIPSSRSTANKLGDLVVHRRQSMNTFSQHIDRWEGSTREDWGWNAGSGWYDGHSEDFAFSQAGGTYPPRLAQSGILCRAMARS